MLRIVETRTRGDELWWARIVGHVYMERFLGIRSAVESLPGKKYRVANQEDINERDIHLLRRDIYLGDLSVIFIHGMSEQIRTIVRSLKQVRHSIRTVGVYHGNSAQWNSEAELVETSRFLTLVSDGHLDAAHLMKPGLDVILDSRKLPQLSNVAPIEEGIQVRRLPGTIFIPSTGGWRKDFLGNLLAAERSPSVKCVLHYEDASVAPFPLRKSHRVNWAGWTAHRWLAAMARLQVAATPIDCHPMVDLEASSVGTPSIHCNHGVEPVLGSTFQKRILVQPIDVEATTERIEDLLAEDDEYLQSEARSYAREISKVSLQRYEDVITTVLNW